MRAGSKTALLIDIIRRRGPISTPDLAAASGVPIEHIAAKLDEYVKRGDIDIAKERSGSRRYNVWSISTRRAPQAAPAPKPRLSPTPRQTQRRHVATPRTYPAAAAGPIDIYRPDASGRLVLVQGLPAPSAATFRDRVGEWAKKQNRPRAQSGGAQRGKPGKAAPC